MRIAHHIPGRIRLVHALWKQDSGNLAEALRRAETIVGVTGAEGRRATGSLILNYDAAVLGSVVHNKAFWRSLLKPNGGSLPPHKTSRPGGPQRRYRHFLQAGLLGSLLTCAVTGFIDREGVHRIAGSLFLLVASGHIHRNRKQLFFYKWSGLLRS